MREKATAKAKVKAKSNNDSVKVDRRHLQILAAQEAPPGPEWQAEDEAAGSVEGWVQAILGGACGEAGGEPLRKKVRARASRTVNLPNRMAE